MDYLYKKLTWLSYSKHIELKLAEEGSKYNEEKDCQDKAEIPEIVQIMGTQSIRMEFVVVYRA